MLFYWYDNLPECELSFEKAEELLLKRFQAYCNNTDLQHDTEGYNYFDKPIHLLMSIITINCPHIKDVYITGELNIFKEKLKSLSSSEIKEELSCALDYLNKFSQSEEYKKLSEKKSKKLKLVQNIILILFNKSSHVFKPSHSVKCRKYKLTLPFTFPLKLVAHRKVEVREGKVKISCGEWDKILEIIFDFFLKLEMSVIEECEKLRKAIYESEDDRIRQLILRFTNFMYGTLNKRITELTADETDVSSQYFPPCMANLHQILRKTHRLSYDSRYQYTLFLKDIGMSVGENIMFWKDEYSKPYEQSSCTHEWKNKGKRYMYQIQYLYGLIGCKKPKPSSSCHQFIQPLLSKMDGGCPFQYLSREKLEEVIPKNIMVLPDVEEVFKYKSCGIPQKACAAYLKCQLKALSRQTGKLAKCNLMFVASPVQYYNMARNQSSDL